MTSIAVPVLLLSLLLMQSCANRSTVSRPRQATPLAQRVIRLADGGSLLIERKNEDGDPFDHVIEYDAKGDAIREDKCYEVTGSYDEYASLFARFRKALVGNDRRSVADLVDYPLKVNTESGSEHVPQKPVANAAELLRRYDQIFHPAFVKMIARVEPRNIWCRSDNFTTFARDGDVGLIYAIKPGKRVVVGVVNN